MLALPLPGKLRLTCFSASSGKDTVGPYTFCRCADWMAAVKEFRASPDQISAGYGLLRLCRSLLSMSCIRTSSVLGVMEFS